ncbi:MAG: hypothetical protein OEY59_07425, partial [Deltaproteobacteria bacterium]|nr:hypothetical protein [Deltaproteobacteria bacterium]
TRYIFDLNGERNEAAFSLDIKQIGLLGDHQKENIQTALAVYFKMIPIENRLSHTRIQEVIRDLSWPCRMEYRESGGLLLDGAHNASGMKSLMDYLQRKHKNDKILVAICWMDDKEIFNQCGGFDLRGMDFLPVTTRLVRSASPLKMVTDLKSYGLSRLQPLRLDDFISSLSQKGYEDYDLVVVTGSLFFLGEFLTSWNIKENHANNLISTVARAQPLKLDSI